MIENTDPEQGLACRRKLVRRYDPTGGDNDIDRLNGLLSWPRAKKIGDVGNTVETWERELNEYCERTSEQFPNRFKVNLLLRMMPPEHEAEIRMRHVTEKSITYAVLREQIETWVHQHLQRTAASSLMSFPRESEDNQEDDDLDALKAKRQESQGTPSQCARCRKA